MYQLHRTGGQSRLYQSLPSFSGAIEEQCSGNDFTGTFTGTGPLWNLQLFSNQLVRVGGEGSESDVFALNSATYIARLQATQALLARLLLLLATIRLGTVLDTVAAHNDLRREIFRFVSNARFSLCRQPELLSSLRIPARSARWSLNSRRSTPGLADRELSSPVTLFRLAPSWNAQLTPPHSNSAGGFEQGAITRQAEESAVEAASRV